MRFLNFHAPGCNFVEYLRGRGEFDQAPPPEDGGRPASDAIVTPPGGGERFQREDRAVTILGDLPEISVLLLEVEPEWPGIPAHAHDDQVDSFFVLEGPAGLVSGDEVVQAEAGTFYVAAAGRDARLSQLGPAGPAQRARPGRRVRREASAASRARRRAQPVVARDIYLNVQCSGWARIAAREKTMRPIAWTWKATSPRSAGCACGSALNRR